MTSITIVAHDGYELSALYGTPTDGAIGTIVISSATGIKKEFYCNFARYLIRQGYNVLLFDYRGIGGSAPEDLRKQKDYMHDWGTKDMNAVVNYLVNERKTIDIIWVGHSVGGQLIGFLENRQAIRKVIAINAALGYWRYFPSRMKWLIWGLWYFVGPLMVGIYGYGKMRKIGWGEDLPRNMMAEWREWCLSKGYFRKSLERELGSATFEGFRVPMTAVYMSDDYMANAITVPLMMDFFPDAPQKIFRMEVGKYTKERVGHIGIFRKKFESVLWPVIVDLIEEPVPFTMRTLVDKRQVDAKVHLTH